MPAAMTSCDCNGSAAGPKAPYTCIALSSAGVLGIALCSVALFAI